MLQTSENKSENELYTTLHIKQFLHPYFLFPLLRIAHTQATSMILYSTSLLLHSLLLQALTIQ